MIRTTRHYFDRVKAHVAAIGEEGKAGCMASPSFTYTVSDNV